MNKHRNVLFFFGNCKIYFLVNKFQTQTCEMMKKREMNYTARLSQQHSLSLTAEEVDYYTGFRGVKTRTASSR